MAGVSPKPPTGHKQPEARIIGVIRLPNNI